MSIYRKKIFPTRLPENYHGQQSPKMNLREQYKLKSLLSKEPNPEVSISKITNWQMKRSNKDIVNQRKQFLVHTGKISNDTPFWFQSTKDFYRREEAQRLKKKQSLEQTKNYDVFNRKRFSLIDWRSSEKHLDEKLATKRNYLMEKNSSWNITGKIGGESNYRTQTLNLLRNAKSSVTPKIGSTEMRDFSVRKPQIKVGKTDFIDTYSPF